MFSIIAIIWYIQAYNLQNIFQKINFVVTLPRDETHVTTTLRHVRLEKSDILAVVEKIFDIEGFQFCIIIFIVNISQVYLIQSYAYMTTDLYFCKYLYITFTEIRIIVYFYTINN